MKLIKKYEKFLLKENLELGTDIEMETEVGEAPEVDTQEVTGGDVTLYRLTSHPVVDLSAPGEYYVKSLEEVSPEFLDEKGDGNYYLITVNCPSSNIDSEASEIECAKHNCESIISVKDDGQCEVIDVKPFKK